MQCPTDLTCDLCGGRPAGCEAEKPDVVVVLQVFKDYGKTISLWEEIDIGHLNFEQLSELIAHNSGDGKSCKIKRYSQ